MRRNWAFFAGLAAAAIVAGCNRNGAEPDPQSTEVPKAVGTGGVLRGAIESNYGTPLKDRVAVIGLLNKRNNLTQDLVLKVGESQRIGNVVVKLASCEKSLPWERPPEIGAFVQMFVEERAKLSEPLAWHKVFSGWLFKNAPSINMVQHPVYDVWVKDCAMKFPGEEENPEDFAAKSKAAKPVGSDTAADSAKEPVAVPVVNEADAGEADR